MKKPSLCSAVGIAVLFAVSVASAQNIYQLTPLSTFGSHGDGSVRPGDILTLDFAFNQRGMAFDGVLTNLVLVDTHTGQGGSSFGVGHIYVLNALTGANLDDGSGGNFKLNTNGIPDIQPSQAYPYAAAAVADDGVVYVCNQDNATSNNVGVTPFMIYRWESSTTTNPPVIAFTNQTPFMPSQRWGTSIDIRGAGTNTQILVGCLANSSSGSNVCIFTTTDGTNFSANILGTDVASGGFNGGVAFGAGNTFWAKQITQPLRCLAFNLATKTATTIRSFTSTTFPDNDNLDTIAVSTNLNLLAAVEQAGGNASGGPDRVRLYDISDFSNSAPALLDVKTFVADNQNTTAPMGYMDFVGTNLYVHVSNNGLLAFGVSLLPPPGPTLTVIPAPTNAVIQGKSVTFNVAGFPSVHYQWQSNGVDIANATNASLTLASVQPSFTAFYTCVVTNISGSTNATTRLEIATSANYYHLNLQWKAYQGDGLDTPTTAPHGYIFNGTSGSGTPNLRSIAYNPLSNHLYAVTRSSNNTSNYVFNVIDASTGNLIYTLKTNGVQNVVTPGGVGLASVACADDGAIYACNMSTQAGGGTTNQVATGYFRIYRWANGDSNTVPDLIYIGDPAINAGFAGATSINRWGDSLAVRGSGTNTLLILDNNNSNVRFVAILRPSDTTMTNWATFGLHQVTTGSTIGRSLEFGSGGTATAGTFWQRRNATALIQSQFDLDSPIDPVPAVASSTAFTNAMSGATIDTTRVSPVTGTPLKLLMGVITYSVSVPADTLDLYEISDLSAPVLLAQYNFPGSNGVRIANSANCINKVIRSGDKLFALDAANGLMAFNIVPGAPTAPGFITQPRNVRVLQGGTASFNVSTDQQADFQWRFGGTPISGATNATYILSNAQPANAGSYTVVATNLFGTSTSAVATLTVISPSNTWSMAPIWSNAIGSQPYLKLDSGGGSPYVRSLGYSAVADKLIFVSRATTTNGIQVNVLDPATGSKLYELNTNGIATDPDAPYATDNIILSSVGVADDGAIYAANVSMANNTSTNANVRLYRWADADSNTAPVLVYEGEPANVTNALRWGDDLFVRGAGTNTQIVLDNQRSAVSVAAVLVPTDATMTVFTNKPFTHSYGTLTIGRSIQFSATNSVWQKSFGGSLKLSSYDLTSQTSTQLTNFNTFPASLGGVYMDFNRNLAAGVDFTGTASTPDTLNFYEISDLSLPLLLAKFNFPTNHQANDNHITQAVFTPSRVFALNANNGLLAFDLAPTLTITPQPPNVLLSWVTNFVGFTLQTNANVATTNWGNLSPGNVVGTQYVVTNDASSANLYYRLRR